MDGKEVVYKGRLITTHFPLTERDLFKIKNGLSDVEYEYIVGRHERGLSPTGLIKMPNGELKDIQK